MRLGIFALRDSGCGGREEETRDAGMVITDGSLQRTSVPERGGSL